jgi:hypothetical protein
VQKTHVTRFSCLQLPAGREPTVAIVVPAAARVRLEILEKILPPNDFGEPAISPGTLTL